MNEAARDAAIKTAYKAMSNDSISAVAGWGRPDQQIRAQ